MNKLNTIGRVRGWTEHEPYRPAKKRVAQSADYRHFLVFDTETTADKEQRLKFGCFQLWSQGESGQFHIITEGLFYADDLPETDPEGYAILQEYVQRGHSRRRGKYVYDSPFKMLSAEDYAELECPCPDAFLEWNYNPHPGIWKLEDILALKPEGVDTSRYSTGGHYPPNEYSRLGDYWEALKDDTTKKPVKDIMLMSQSEFIKDVLKEACFPDVQWINSEEGRASTLVAHNLPFDLSRIANGVVKPRGKYFANGFSLDIGYGNMNAVRLAKRGAKGSSFGFTGNPRDNGKRDEGDFNGYFTDTAVLGFALTNNMLSLAKAGEAFNTEHRKIEDEQDFGLITLDHITYCRHDVLTTGELYLQELAELSRHPIELDDSKTISPASIAKAYLKAMGVVTPLQKQADFSNAVHGHAMGTFYGGRSEAHIRRSVVPVVYNDFSSMYPSVNANLHLWDLLTAKEIEPVECAAEVRGLLSSLTVETLLDKAAWPKLRGIALVRPDGDLLPLRTEYAEGNSRIGVAYVTSAEPMWYTLPDIANSTLHTGKVPEILRAIRFDPAGGVLESLQPVDIRGDESARIDPSSDDFFRAVIEKRFEAKNRRTCGGKKGCTCESCLTVEFMKVLANSGSYGIFAEVNRDEGTELAERVIFGAGEQAWKENVRKPENPGTYCFPGVSSVITGSARLMLGILEYLVTQAGGTWVMCDTDSMAVVASAERGHIETGASIPPRSCDAETPGAIPVLSYADVEEIRERFESLNPYNPALGVKLLKREHSPQDDDYSGDLYCYAVSAKRYALFVPDESEGIRIVENKESGLGLYMNPIDPKRRDETKQRDWATDAWRYMIGTDAGLGIAEPEWFDNPAMMRLTVSTWNVYESFATWNEGKPYAEQVKPHNFLISPVTKDHPVMNVGRNTPLRLVGPFSTDSDEWFDMEYINMHAPEEGTYRIARDVDYRQLITPDNRTVPVKTYREVVKEYSRHPEVVFTGPNGEKSHSDTRGVLQRHHVFVAGWDYVGKESNHLDKDKGIVVLGPGDVALTEYGNGRDEFLELAVPVLKTIPRADIIAAVKADGGKLSMRGLMNNLSGSTTPRDGLKKSLIKLAVKEAAGRLGGNIPKRTWKNPELAMRHWREILTAHAMNNGA